MKRILVTGTLGQIGSELLERLRDVYGENNVIGSDIRSGESESGPFEVIDVTNGVDIFDVAKNYQVDTIIHLAALLSATAEEMPQKAWDINMGGLMNVLEVARELDLKVFSPSTIGSFGPSTPKDNTPQVTLQRPISMYGVNKVAGELLCDYYYHRFGVDARGVRYPGLISNVKLPVGGTTDYAAHIYDAAVKDKQYTCYLQEGTYMDMMYMPDALQAIIQLMEANPDKLTHRNAYNVTSFSAAPEDFAREIRKHIPEFTMSYDVDLVRQRNADSWPNSLDASVAKEEWGFKAKYGIEEVTVDMLDKMRSKIKVC